MFIEAQVRGVSRAPFSRAGRRRVLGVALELLDPEQFSFRTYLAVAHPSRPDAYVAVMALKELARDNAFTMHSLSAILTSGDGTPVVLDLGTPANTTSIGALNGALRDLLAIPTTPAGSSPARGVLDLWAAFLALGISEDFARGILSDVEVGRSVVLVEIDDDMSEGLDRVMAACNGVVRRESRQDVEAATLVEHITALSSALRELRAQETRDGAPQDGLAAQIVEATNRLTILSDRAKAKLDGTALYTDRRLKALQERGPGATPSAQAPLEERIQTLRTASARRTTALRDAWHLTREVLVEPSSFRPLAQSGLGDERIESAHTALPRRSTDE